MMAVETGLHATDLPDDKAQLHAAISEAIPLSAGKYNTDLYSEETKARIVELEALRGYEQAEAIAPNWRLQLGSLGSGNHFIEVSLDERNGVWLFLHSGSRGVGNKLAMKHIKVAQTQCEKRFITLPDRDLAYLVEGDPEFWAYMEALRWAQRFAYLNRAEMMHRVVDCFLAWTMRDTLPDGRRGHQLSPQLHDPGEALREGRVALPQGRDRRRRGCARSHPGVDGHPVLRRGREGQPARAELLAARRRPEPLAVGRQEAVHAH
jgi:hypothetical protein